MWQLPQAARIDTTDQAAYTTQVCLTAHRLGVQEQGVGPPRLPEAAVVLVFFPWLHLHLVFTLCLASRSLLVKISTPVLPKGPTNSYMT